MKCAHESKPLRRGAGAESPTFDYYSATGAEKLKWASNSTGNGVSLAIFGACGRDVQDIGESITRNSCEYLIISENAWWLHVGECAFILGRALRVLVYWDSLRMRVHWH